MSRPPKPLFIAPQLQQRYLAGEFTQVELAQHLGVSVSWLRRELIRLGLPTRSPVGRRWALRTVPRELVEGYVRGDLSAVDIAKWLGVSRVTVAARLREQGVHVRTPSEVASLQRQRLYAPRDREIRRLQAEGSTVTALAGRFGISCQRVRQILKPATGGP